MCKVSGVRLNYTTSQLVNFYSIRDKILGADAREVIIFHRQEDQTKMRKCDGGDTMAVVSEPEQKVQSISS